MKTIYFISNINPELFPNNTRSKFQNYIDINILNNLPSGSIEVALKSITFDNTVNGEVKDVVLGLQSDIIHPIINSSTWSQTLSMFTVNKEGVTTFDFINPTFFPSSKESLSKATFKLVDLSTNEAPDFTFGSPTFVQIVVRSAIQRMKTPFQLILDSSCPISKEVFPTNTNMEFSIKLPKSMHFERDWSVALKGMNITNEFQRLHDCYVSLYNQPIHLMEDYVDSIDHLLTVLNRYVGIYLKFKVRGGIVKITNGRMSDRYLGAPVNISKNLSYILGLRPEDTSFELKKDLKIEAVNKANIQAVVPQHLIVCCNLVEHSVLGNQQVQILKYVPNKNKANNAKAVDVEFISNDYQPLELKTFNTIKIRIADVTGATIKASQRIPTRLQLLFINTNSF